MTTTTPTDTSSQAALQTKSQPASKIPALLPSVRKELVVRCRPELAFDVFTARMSDWWPLATHSVGAEEARSVTVEPEAGGRLYETCADGAEHLWGRVTHWDPPSGFDCTWHPGRDDTAATNLSLRFHPHDDGTLVVLDHLGWEILGDQAEEVRSGYDGGWQSVFLEQYAAAVESATNAAQH